MSVAMTHCISTVAKELPLAHSRCLWSTLNARKIGAGRDAVWLDEHVFASGGMATIRRGTAVGPDGRPKSVMVKEASPGFERFLATELEVSSQLYPGEVRRLAVDGHVYMVMDVFPGDPRFPDEPAKTLHRALYSPNLGMPQFANGPRRDPEFIRLTMEALVKEVDRLHALDKRYVHADLKPENILIGVDANGKPRVRLIDFGLTVPENKSGKLLDYLGGSPEYFGMEAFLAREVTTQRDIHALQKIFMEMLRPDLFRDLTVSGNGVQRAMNGGKWKWWDLKRTPDEGPAPEAQAALVLRSGIPGSTAELKMMLGEAGGDPSAFTQAFARRWSEAYAVADPVQKSLLVHELVAATKLGPRVFARLSPELQKVVVAEAVFRKNWVPLLSERPPTDQPLIGWHVDSGRELDAFLGHADVMPLVGNVPPAKMEIFRGRLEELGKYDLVHGTAYAAGLALYVIKTTTPKQLPAGAPALVAPLREVTRAAAQPKATPEQKKASLSVFQRLAETPDLEPLFQDAASATKLVDMLADARALPAGGRPGLHEILPIYSPLVLSLSGTPKGVDQKTLSERWKLGIRAARAAESYLRSIDEAELADEFARDAQALERKFQP